MATGVPTLWRNENAWTKVANVLIYDSPAPVGFSYCNNNTGGDGYSCGNWDDTRTARAAHVFMKNWMKAFPAFASLDLYLSGESYAGVYIPMLAQVWALVQHSVLPRPRPSERQTLHRDHHSM